MFLVQSACCVLLMRTVLFMFLSGKTNRSRLLYSYKRHLRVFYAAVNESLKVEAHQPCACEMKAIKNCNIGTFNYDLLCFLYNKS